MSEREELLEEEISQLKDVIEQVKISHSWMLTSIKHGSDETSGGNYSDELKHSILTQEILELL